MGNRLTDLRQAIENQRETNVLLQANGQHRDSILQK